MRINGRRAEPKNISPTRVSRRSSADFCPLNEKFNEIRVGFSIVFGSASRARQKLSRLLNASPGRRMEMRQKYTVTPALRVTRGRGARHSATTRNMKAAE